MRHPKVVFVALACGIVSAQTTFWRSWTAGIPADLKFEVASLLPSPPNSPGGGIRPAPGGERYLASGVTLRTLIIVAFRVRPDQITGGPSWMSTEHFDMNAKSERSASIDELHVMLQNLLADRFKLRFHIASKQAPIYVLSVENSGSKLVRHEPRTPDETSVDLDGEGLKVLVRGRAAPLNYFAWRLSQVLDRPVSDRTQIQGGYDFDLSFFREMPEVPTNAGTVDIPPDVPGPTVFEAMRDQLGLRLDRSRGTVDVMVVDSAEKPTEN